MRKSNEYSRKFNNDGFTLLEVLIAVIILAVVSIPLLRSFATVADTNKVAKIQAKATTAAESVMEDCKYLKLEDVYAKYYGPNTDSDGDGVLDTYTLGASDIYTAPGPSAGSMDQYKIIISDTTAVTTESLGLPAGYSIEVIFNPNKYVNANEFNYADLSTVSSTTSAIFTMNSSMDKEVYAAFSAASKDYLGTDGEDDDFFKGKVKRTIYVTIDKVGSDTDDDGNDVDLVDVIISAKYELLPGAYSYVSPANRTIKKMDKLTIYTNSTSKLAMQSVYVMYQPLYGAGSKNDIISVDNSKNVPCNLYIVAQDTDGHKTDWKEYLKNKTLDLIIYEDAKKNENEANIRLRTNVFEGKVKKTKTDSGDAEIKCNVGYYSGVHKIADGNAACKLLDAASLDGRTFDVDNLGNKIYSVRIDVYNSNSESLSTIKGSKLE